MSTVRQACSQFTRSIGVFIGNHPYVVSGIIAAAGVITNNAYVIAIGSTIAGSTRLSSSLRGRVSNPIPPFPDEYRHNPHDLIVFCNVLRELKDKPFDFFGPLNQPTTEEVEKIWEWMHGSGRKTLAKFNPENGLDFSHQALTSVPSPIGYLRKVRSIGLSYNLLTELPPEIGKCSGLIALDLRNNQLTALPSEIGEIKNLEFLFLDRNPIEALPVEVTQHPKIWMLSERTGEQH